MNGPVIGSDGALSGVGLRNRSSLAAVMMSNYGRGGNLVSDKMRELVKAMRGANVGER